MCLAVPVQIIESDGSRAVADSGGNRIPVDLSLVPGAAVGDWVIVHAGFAIQRYSPEEAAETLDLFRQIADLTENQ